MDNLFLAIVTRDKEYGRSLSLAMLSVCRSFIIRIFSAEEFLEENRDYDIVLWDGEEVREAYGGRIVYLAEKPSEAIRNISQKRFCLYKYSSAACIVSAIFEIYKELTGRRAMNIKTQDVRLFAFASFAGGSGCTTIAMAIAQEFTRFYDKKVMYLSFEELDSAGEYMKHEQGIKGAEVYLYRLFNKMYPNHGDSEEEKSIPFIEGHIVRDEHGVEAFAPSAARNPLREVRPDEINKLMVSLIDSGRYDVIIIDMGNWLSKTGLKCLQMTEKLCVVSTPESSQIKEHNYNSHLVACCGEEIMGKCIRVLNHKRKNSLEKSGADSNFTEYIDIRRCTGIMNDENHKTIILEGEFGNDISCLAEKLMEPM